MSKPAVFFDRDGIVNERIVGDYVKSIKEFQFIPNFFTTFKLVLSSDCYSFLVSNQQGIGKGLMTELDLKEIHNFMNLHLISNTGNTFDEIFYCSSLDEQNDFRRKPNPGMILEAIEKYKLEKSLCIFIGDSLSDVKAGKNAGIKTILISKESLKENDKADYQFNSLKELNSELPKILEELSREYD